MTRKNIDEIVDKAVKDSIQKVLDEDFPVKSSEASNSPMTYNQKMSLNEMAQINVNERESDKKSSLNCDIYYVYVKGEGADKKFPHFHIKSKSEGWDIRMNMDGSLNSIKTGSNKRQTPDDFIDIERVAKIWVAQPNTLEPNKTNGEVAKNIWIRNNN